LGLPVLRVSVSSARFWHPPIPCLVGRNHHR
jgi:hypothetical protein